MWTNWVAIVLSLVAFLGGLRLMRSGTDGIAEGKLSNLLKALVKSPSRGIATGTVATGILQSSAAITAMTVGFVAGGTMTFRNALGVILGSNVGGTVTPQILTLNLWGIVIPALGFGIIGFLSGKEKLRRPSMALVGFACIFISLQSLQVALHPIAAAPWFIESLTKTASNPWIAALAGCIASALIQSSTATTVITMALMSQGTMPLPAAIAIVLGANVGTCLTSIIASLGTTREAKQVALSHVLLNAGGVLIFLPLIHPFSQSMRLLSNNPSQQIANAHTVFNLICTLGVWPFCEPFARGIERLLPQQVST
jgi:phosphate:Na+ symporter